MIKNTISPENIYAELKKSPKVYNNINGNENMCLIRDKTIRKKRNKIIYSHRGREDRKHANDIVGNHDVKIDTITKKISQPRDLQCKSLVIHEGRKK